MTLSCSQSLSLFLALLVLMEAALCCGVAFLDKPSRQRTEGPCGHQLKKKCDSQFNNLRD